MMDIAEKVRRKVDREIVSSQLRPARAVALYTSEVFKCKVFGYMLLYSSIYIKHIDFLLCIIDF